MTQLDPRRIRRHFSTHADEYDRYAVVQKRVVDRLCAVLPSALPNGPRLDLGCGTGALASRFPAGGSFVVVADLAHNMTCSACRQLPAVCGVDADAAALPFADRSFSLVASASMYQWVEDLSAAFAEVQRILRPDGTFAVALFGAATLHELRASRLAALAEIGGESTAMQRFPTVADVAAALERAGFTAEVSACFDVEEHPDVATLLRNLKRIGAQNATAGQPGGLRSRTLMARLQSHYVEIYGRNNKIPATYEVILALARPR